MKLGRLRLLATLLISLILINLPDVKSLILSNRRIETSLFSSREGNRSDGSVVRFRDGSKDDEFFIASTMAKELMNPLGIDSKRFLVAVADSDNNDNAKSYGRKKEQLVGWAQLRPLGPVASDPGVYNAAPGSASYSLDREVDDEMWALFEEDDEVEFPTGLASLPWTKEYRAYSEAAAKRREKRTALVAKEQMRIDRELNLCWELASVWVSPSFRNQGIGSKLVQKILARHTSRGRTMNDIYLLTLKTTENWYKQFGFEITDNPPSQMKVEIAAGQVITKYIVGNELICMKGGSARKN